MNQTTSLAIAEGTQLDHKTVIQLVRNKREKLQQFNPLSFKNLMGKALPQGGHARRTEYAILTEPQATLLLAFMRNSPIVEDFKVHLVEEFTGCERSLTANY